MLGKLQILKMVASQVASLRLIPNFRPSLMRGQVGAMQRGIQSCGPFNANLPASRIERVFRQNAKHHSVRYHFRMSSFESCNGPESQSEFSIAVSR